MHMRVLYVLVYECARVYGSETKDNGTLLFLVEHETIKMDIICFGGVFGVMFIV